jgi:hypothetical protein
MDIIIASILVGIGLTLIFLVGNFFGQGVMIGYLLYGNDPDEISVGKSWYDAFMWGLENEKSPLYRILVRIVLAGVKSYGKSHKECRDA